MIKSLHCYAYRIPMRNTFTTAHGSLPVREGAIVELQTDNGLAGFGDIAPLPEFCSGTLSDALNALPELVTCISAMSIDEALTFLWRHINEYPSSLVSGIELAMLDVQGKSRRCPISQILLEYSGQTGIYAARKRVSVNTVIGATTLDAAVEKARSAVLKGFGCIKLKVGAGQALRTADPLWSPEDREKRAGTSHSPYMPLHLPTTSIQKDEQATIERVAAVRQAIGPTVHLRLDANEAWSFEQAKAILRACEAFGVQYVEQPLPKHDIAGMARLRRVVSIPIAADEAVSDLESARQIIHARAADVLVVKPQFAHGLRMAQQIIIEAEEQEIHCVLTSAMESGIGVAGVLHLAAALPEITLYESANKEEIRRGSGLSLPMSSGSDRLPGQRQAARRSEVEDSPFECKLVLECGLATLPLLEHDLLIESLQVDNGWMRVPAGAGLGVEPDIQALERYR